MSATGGNTDPINNPANNQNQNQNNPNSQNQNNNNPGNQNQNNPGSQDQQRNNPGQNEEKQNNPGPNQNNPSLNPDQNNPRQNQGTPNLNNPNQDSPDKDNPYPNTNPDREKGEPFKIYGDWNKQSSQLKNQYSQLTDSDLQYEPGKENDMLERVGSKLNKNRDEVINIINRSQS